MSPSIDTRETRAFAREIKFLIDDATAARVRVWARAHLGPDPNAIGAWGDEYLTTSIYFDNPRFDVFRQQGSHGRTKYRLRRYGVSSDVYLERKLRNPRLLSKRRTSIDLGEIDRLSGRSASTDNGWAGDWFHRRLLLRGLNPACQVSYQRMARVALGAYGPIRLTIDDDIRALPAAGFLFRDERGARVLDGYKILELKYRFAMPAMFKQLVEEFVLSPMAVSKYRLSAATALKIAAAVDGAGWSDGPMVRGSEGPAPVSGPSDLQTFGPSHRTTLLLDM